MIPHRFIWQKHHRIYAPDHTIRWVASHAQCPTAYQLTANKLRVYFAVRNHEGCPLTIYLECHPEYPEHVTYVHTHPVLPLGSAGNYDQNGMVPGSVVNHGDRVDLYYTGWNTQDFQQYQMKLSYARSFDKGQTFISSSPLILLGRDFLNAMSPWVVKQDYSYHMWFAASDTWVDRGGKIEAGFDLYYAVSDDGVTWIVDDSPLLEAGIQREVRTRPCVWHDGKIWHMWFSYHTPLTHTSQLGYASSADLKTWVRDDSQSVLKPSVSGWDCEMIADPCVLQIHDHLMLLYNGNNYGETGFGYGTIDL